MKTKASVFFYVLLVIALSVSCKEDNVNEPNIPKFDIEGKITSNNLPDGISNIILTLGGSETFSDTTDETGNYFFSNIPQGDYHLLVNDPLFEKVDTLISVNNNIEINLILTSMMVDYFPINVENQWNFEFYYQRCSSCLFDIQGNIFWEIIGVDDSFVVSFEETIEAIQREQSIDYPNKLWDTTYVSQIDTFQYLMDNENYFIQQTDHFLSSLGGIDKLKFKTMFPFEDKEEILLKNYSWGEPRDGELFVLGTWEMNDLNLQKHVGIKQWKVTNSSSGGAKLDVNLTYYKIAK